MAHIDDGLKAVFIAALLICGVACSSLRAADGGVAERDAIRCVEVMLSDSSINEVRCGARRCAVVANAVSNAGQLTDVEVRSERIDADRQIVDVNGKAEEGMVSATITVDANLCQVELHLVVD
jgi:hypothetical protein